MNLADIIGVHAAKTPRAEAVIEGERRFNYLEFERAIWRAAQALRAAGVRPRDVIGLSIDSTALHLVVCYALARIGAVQLALSRRESATQRRALAARFGAAAIVGDRGQCRVDGLAFHRAESSWLDPSAAVPEARVSAPGGDAPWKIILSSGTTGPPKAVLQTHAMHVAWRETYVRAMPIEASDRYLSVVSLHFYAGLRQCMETHWSGAGVILERALRTPQEILKAIRDHRATYLSLMATHLRQLLPLLPADGPPLPGLRVLRSGAMVVSDDLRHEIKRRLTPNLIVTYGTNDVGSPMCRADPQTESRFPGSVGLCSPGVEVEIVDEAGRSLAPGETGFIRVRAPAMPEGYLDDAEASAQAFRAGWYYPGDLGKLVPGGALYYMGRTDDLMNYDGVKIYPSEIESALLEHPAVAEVAAFPIASRTHQDLPAVAVVLKRRIDRAEFERWCRERLGSSAPRVFAVVGALPRNAMGKVVKSGLAQSIGKRWQRKKLRSGNTS